jgi:hypothetical protein
MSKGELITPFSFFGIVIWNNFIYLYPVNFEIFNRRFIEKTTFANNFYNQLT